MKNLRMKIGLVFTGLLISTSAAMACPDGYYETCFIKCFCVPNSGKASELPGEVARGANDEVSKIPKIIFGAATGASTGAGNMASSSPLPPPSAAPQLLPAGYPLSSCGCWGPLPPGANRPAPACASGVDVPRACPGYCPSGGSPYQGSCY